MIKTIRNYHKEDFDAEVNKYLDEGYNIQYLNTFMDNNCSGGNSLYSYIT
jgi:hypothetical protein